MIKFKIHIIILFLSLCLINSCSKVRESAGVGRKSPDEFQVIENPPLVIPPDFSLVPPGQLQEKTIDNTEANLAEEILFGLDEKNSPSENQLSTMNQILSKTDAINVSDSIRDEIDENFSNETKKENFFQNVWENEIEVLNAVEESKRIREKIFNNESIVDDDIPIKKEKVKNKKKKRFIFF